MGTYKKRTATNGFTLIEMLIVIVIISILALIVIPRLLSAGRRAKESNLRAQLHEMRTAIAKFEADLGDNPLSLDHLMTRPAAGSSGGSGVVLDVVSWKEPYFRTPNDELPIDPMTGNNTWSYISATGALASTSTLTAINGEPYNTW